MKCCFPDRIRYPQTQDEVLQMTYRFEQKNSQSPVIYLLGMPGNK